jgi:outer membrane protein OmpA-like peptidoglycan-associated protein
LVTSKKRRVKMKREALISVRRWRTLIILMIIFLVTAGCASSGGVTDTGKGALLGAGGGALVGALVDMNGDPLAGALVGAAGGALVGALVGHHMDQTKQDLVKGLQPEINAGQAQVQVLPDNAIQVSMTGRTAFAPGSAVINQGFVPTLQKIASVVSKYGKMTIAVIGHPDAGGTVSEKQWLAYQRAEAVRVQLIAMGVKPILVAATDNPGNAYTDGRIEVILTPLRSS